VVALSVPSAGDKSHGPASKGPGRFINRVAPAGIGMKHKHYNTPLVLSWYMDAY